MSGMLRIWLQFGLVVVLLWLQAGVTLPASGAVIGSDGATSLAGERVNGERQLAASAAESRYAATVLADRPLGYWRLGEKTGAVAGDSSGSGLHGQYGGAVTRGQAGALPSEVDTAAELDGLTAFVALPEGFADFSDGLTIEAWIYPAPHTWSQRIVELGNGQTSDSIIFARGEEGTDLRIEIYRLGELATRVKATDVLKPNRWQHVAVSIDSGGAVRIYRDLEPVAIGTGRLPRNVVRTTNYLGRGADPVNGFYGGRLDEVGIYATALGSHRLQARHDAALARPSAPTNVSAQAGIERATVRWSPPAFPGTTPVAWYTVTSSGGQVATVPGTARSASVAGLTTGTPYTFTVTAMNGSGAGPASPPSNSVTPAALPGSLYGTAVLTDQPLGYWRLDETSGTVATDSSGNGNGAKYAGPIALGQLGALQSEANPTAGFDGSGAHVVLPSGFASFESGLTIEAWAHPTASNWSARLVDLGNGQNSDNVIFSRAGGGGDLRFEVYRGGSLAGQVTAPNALQIGTWQHLVATVTESGAATIYRNGQVVASGTVALPRTVTRTSNFIGRSNWSGDAFFAGRLDEVAIYATALPADRVVAHSEAAVGPPGAPSNVTALAGIEKATVTWTPPFADPRDPILEYKVTSSGGTIVKAPGPATSVTVTGLASGVPVSFTVSATSAARAGPVSTASNVVTPTAPPDSAYPLAVLTDQPLGYWRFDEIGATQAADSSGNGNGGEYAGAVQTGQPGALATDSNQTVTFNGTDAHVVLPSGFRSFDRGLTIEAWAHPTASNWSARLVDLGNGPNADNVILSRSEGGTDLRLEVYHGGSVAGQVTAPDALQIGTWQHLVATVTESGAATIYRNGQVVASGNLPLPRTVTRSSNFVGRSNWSGDAFFAGRLDEVAIYATALPADRVVAHSEAAVGPPGAPSNVTALAGIEKATITWSPPAGDSRDPILEHTVTSSAGQRLTVPSPATSATLTGLAAGTPHTFTVSTRSSKGVSPVSAASNVITPTAPPSSAYALAVLTDQPLGYWRFDESEARQAADSSGNGYTATYAGTVQTGQPGALRTDSNPTISFDGTDAHVVLPSGFRGLDRGLTIEAWAHPTASSWAARLVELGNGPNADNVILSRSEGGTDLRLEVYHGGSLAGQLVAPGALVLEAWQHLVATVDANGAATIYRNGQPVAAGNVPLPQAVTRSSNYVARSNWSGDGFFSGRIDEVAIYPAALSAARVQAHYDAAGGTLTTSASRERR